VRFATSPGKVEVGVGDLNALFDRTPPPTYPHTGPMLNKAVARFLVDSVREQRRTPEIEVPVALRTAPRSVPRRRPAAEPR
jgi:hypothetical protein